MLCIALHQQAKSCHGEDCTNCLKLTSSLAPYMYMGAGPGQGLILINYNIYIIQMWDDYDARLLKACLMLKCSVISNRRIAV